MKIDFESIVGISALIALIVAIFSELHIRKLMSDVNGNIYKSFEILAKVEGLEKVSKIISDSLSTHYVGNFPANMDEIIKLIPTANRSLVIVCDVPAFGHFSNPEGFRDYNLAFQNLLNRQKNRPEVTLITYDLQRRLCNSANQFGPSFEEFKKGFIYKHYFEYWNSDKKEPDVKTMEDFCKWVDNRHRRFQADLDEKGVKVYETSKDLRAFLWIADEKDAIFSFYNYGSENREVSFRTNDKKLIDSLLLIAKEAQNLSTRKEDFDLH